MILPLSCHEDEFLETCSEGLTQHGPRSFSHLIFPVHFFLYAKLYSRPVDSCVALGFEKHDFHFVYIRSSLCKQSESHAFQTQGQHRNPQACYTAWHKGRSEQGRSNEKNCEAHVVSILRNTFLKIHLHDMTVAKSFHDTNDLNGYIYTP